MASDGPRLYRIAAEDIERLERSARTPDAGGWQALCARIVAGEVKRLTGALNAMTVTRTRKRKEASV